MNTEESWKFVAQKELQFLNYSKKTLLESIREEKERKRSSDSVRKNQQSEQYYKK